MCDVRTEMVALHLPFPFPTHRNIYRVAQFSFSLIGAPLNQRWKGGDRATSNRTAKQT